MPYNSQLIYRLNKGAENPADLRAAIRVTQTVRSATLQKTMWTTYATRQCQQQWRRKKSSESRRRTLSSKYLSRPLRLRSVKDELLVYQWTVLRGNRIVVPKALRDRVVNLAHVGPQGIAKRKRLIREKVWFTGVDMMVKEEFDSCLPYQAATASKAERFEPLRMTPLPNAHGKNSRWIF